MQRLKTYFKNLRCRDPDVVTGGATSDGYTVSTNIPKSIQRGRTLSLYRSNWVPKGACGNTHGFSQQKFVASLPANTTAIPENVGALLTPSETAYVEHRICAPARKQVAELQAAAVKREVDPIWRINEAVRLLEEAAVRSADAVVPDAVVKRVNAAVEKIKTVGQHTPQPNSLVVQTDPMREALMALRNAAQAVKGGRYGNGPSEGMKITHIYARWLELQAALEGQHDGSLMRCLQARGFVKTRQR